MSDVTPPPQPFGSQPPNSEGGAAPVPPVPQAPPGYVQPQGGYVAPPPGYVALPPGYVAPPPGYVAPPPGYVQPQYPVPGHPAQRPGYGAPQFGAPGVAPAYGGAPAAGSVSGIGKATGILVGATGVLAVLTAIIEAWGWSIIANGMFAPSVAGFTAYQGLSTLIRILSLVSMIAAAVCWLVWQHRAAASVHPGLLRRSPGWHVGSWFIPIVAWWFPLQNVSDLAKATRAPVSRALLGWWWGMWVAASVSPVITNNMIRGVITTTQLDAAMLLSVLSSVFLAAAAPFAWLIVTRITNALTPPAR